MNCHHFNAETTKCALEKKGGFLCCVMYPMCLSAYECEHLRSCGAFKRVCKHCPAMRKFVGSILKMGRMSVQSEFENGGK